VTAPWRAFRRWLTPGTSKASWRCLRCAQTGHGYGDTGSDAIDDAIRNGDAHQHLGHGQAAP